MRIHQCMHPRVLAWVRRRGIDLRNLVHICFVVGFVMMIHEKKRTWMRIYMLALHTIHMKIAVTYYITSSYYYTTHFPLDRLIYQNASGFSNGRLVGNLVGLLVGRLLG